MAPYRESLYTLACLSDNVYHLHNITSPTTLSDHDIKTLNARVNYRVISESIIMNEKLVCGMAVWQHASDPPLRILVIKGTNPTSVSDLLNDLAMVEGGVWSLAILGTLGKARELIAKFGVQLVTGHSLGGYAAEILATNDGLNGASFCNPGVNGPVVQFGGSPRQGFHNINMQHDPIGNYNCASWHHVQWSVYVGRNGHGIANMVDYFCDKQHIDNVDVYSHCKSRLTGYYYPK